MLRSPDNNVEHAPIERHLTVKDAAPLLGYTNVGSLWNALERCDPRIMALKPVKLLGRTWRFPLAAIQEAYRRGQQEAMGKARLVRIVRRARP